MRKDFEGGFLDVIEQGRDEGVFHADDTHDRARAILGMVQAVALWFHPRGELAPSELAARYVAMARRLVHATDHMTDRGAARGVLPVDRPLDL